MRCNVDRSPVTCACAEFVVTDLFLLSDPPCGYLRFDARSLSLAVGHALRATPIKDVYSKNEKIFKRLQEVRLSHRIESQALHLVQSLM